MEEIRENKLNVLLDDVNKEFYNCSPSQRVKFAVEQMSLWQHKFTEAKKEIPEKMYGCCIANGSNMSSFLLSKKIH